MSISIFIFFKKMVGLERFELSKNNVLSVARLPIAPQTHTFKLLNYKSFNRKKFATYRTFILIIRNFMFFSIFSYFLILYFIHNSILFYRMKNINKLVEHVKIGVGENRTPVYDKHHKQLIHNLVSICSA